MFPLLKPFIKYANDSLFNGILKTKCPYGPGWIEIVNGTVAAASIVEMDKTQSFPNGIYKVLFKTWNKQDDNILSFTTFAEANFRASTLDFFDKF